ncbi:unnamed protein product [Auanema sp. JU1783]|nr:unnamed protein product [Auanema sp. JU1783]
MNNQNPSVLGQLDLQALLASMPQEFRNSANVETSTSKQDIMPMQQSHIFNNEQLNHFILQLHNQAAASAVAAAAIASTIASSTHVGSNTGVFTNPSTTTPTATLAATSGSGLMYSALPPHSSFGFLSNMNQLRSSVSALPSPVSSNNQITPDVRPRAFSSAATLQNTRESPIERRRKRSHRMEAPAKPIAIRPMRGEGSSVLRHLVETEDEPNQIRLPPIPTSQDEFKLRMDMAKVSVLNNNDHNAKKSQEIGKGIRRIIDDQDLPESVGPDSPFRHHPKYQKKAREGTDMADAIAAFCVGMWKSENEGKDLDKASNDSENAIVRELKLEA